MDRDTNSTTKKISGSTPLPIVIGQIMIETSPSFNLQAWSVRTRESAMAELYLSSMLEDSLTYWTWEKSQFHRWRVRHLWTPLLPSILSPLSSITKWTSWKALTTTTLKANKRTILPTPLTLNMKDESCLGITIPQRNRKKWRLTLTGS